MLDFSYCEAAVTTWIPQPMNVISSVAFFFLALYIQPKLYRTPISRVMRYAIVWLTALIGFGSIAWHITSSYYGLALDILPIFSIILLLQYMFYVYVLQCSVKRGTLLVGLYLFATLICVPLFKDIIPQSSGAFLPVLVWLLTLAVMLRRTMRKVALMFSYGFVSFSVALAARLLDIPLCADVDIGTHFLWHSFAALTLYYGLCALILGMRHCAYYPNSASTVSGSVPPRHDSRIWQSGRI